MVGSKTSRTCRENRCTNLDKEDLDQLSTADSLSEPGWEKKPYKGEPGRGCVSWKPAFFSEEHSLVGHSEPSMWLKALLGALFGALSAFSSSARLAPRNGLPDRNFLKPLISGKEDRPKRKFPSSFACFLGMHGKPAKKTRIFSRGERPNSLEGWENAQKRKEFLSKETARHFQKQEKKIRVYVLPNLQLEVKSLESF